MRWISVLTNVADQLYYPCEHIAWAADAELIKVKSEEWWLFTTVLWGTSLLLGILRWDSLPVPHVRSPRNNPRLRFDITTDL